MTEGGTVTPRCCPLVPSIRRESRLRNVLQTFPTRYGLHNAKQALSGPSGHNGPSNPGPSFTGILYKKRMIPTAQSTTFCTKQANAVEMTPKTIQP